MTNLGVQLLPGISGSIDTLDIDLSVNESQDEVERLGGALRSQLKFDQLGISIIVAPGLNLP